MEKCKNCNYYSDYINTGGECSECELTRRVLGCFKESSSIQCYIDNKLRCEIKPIIITP